jgi:1-acyl-sn-glycerol-3-phosphate acyltransferase
MQGARKRMRWVPLVAALLTATGCATLGRGGERETAAEAAKRAPLDPLSLSPERFLAEARGTYVVVDLDSNRLRLMDGRRTLWEAPVGTGTGLRLRGPDGEWHFSTPRGVFQIQYKEEVPIWVLPDWYFVEKGLPIPDRNAPERRVRNQLGIAAVYIGEEIAIHGTDRPELLGKRVSHGCIRLENQYALRLFHNVQVGTPVVVVGGEGLDDEPPAETTDPGKPGPRPRDPLAGVSTEQLLARLDRALAAERPTTAWVPLASRLITRGLKDDAVALRGLLTRAGTAADEGLNREYATFLADVFSRGSLRTVVSLARVDEEARRRAAEAIVRATLSLHPGALDESAAPWPTGRVPPGRLGPDGRAGWEALATAEAEYRTGTAAAASRQKGGA